jgi:hypothetical protein
VLQGTLSNLAAGVMLLLFRPFHIGDDVEVAGKAGRVKALSLFMTELVAPDKHADPAAERPGLGRGDHQSQRLSGDGRAQGLVSGAGGRSGSRHKATKSSTICATIRASIGKTSPPCTSRRWWTSPTPPSRSWN